MTNPGAGTGQITKLTATGCTSVISNLPCTFATSASVGNPWHLTATADAGTSGSGQWHISNVTTAYTCKVFSFDRTCTYEASTATAHFFGSDSTPTIEMTGVALSKENPSDALCSATATVEGRYELTTPTSMWVT